MPDLAQRRASTKAACSTRPPLHPSPPPFNYCFQLKANKPMIPLKYAVHLSSLFSQCPELSPHACRCWINLQFWASSAVSLILFPWSQLVRQTYWLVSTAILVLFLLFVTPSKISGEHHYDLLSPYWKIPHLQLNKLKFSRGWTAKMQSVGTTLSPMKCHSQREKQTATTCKHLTILQAAKRAMMWEQKRMLSRHQFTYCMSTCNVSSFLSCLPVY